MNKFKAFIIGVVTGSCLICAVGYAADAVRIEVKFPDLSYWLDGKPLHLTSETSAQASSLQQQHPPSTILYNGANYVLLRSFANELGKEVQWDERAHKITLHTVEEWPFEAVEPEQAPQEIQDWVNESKFFEMGQIKKYGKETYILVTRGEKKTGGYAAEIERIQQFSDHLKVTVNLADPPKGYAVIQPIEYPFSLVKTSGPLRQPALFKDDEGNHIPGLVSPDRSVGSMSKIVKQNQDLCLFSPVYTSTGIRFRGMVRDFEGLVSYRLLDSKGLVLDSGTLQAEASAPDWGLFSTSIERTKAMKGAVITFQASSSVHEDDAGELALRLNP